MNTFFDLIKKMLFGVVDAANAQVEKYGARYVAFGTFSLVNYVFPLYMWSEENCIDTAVLSIRALAGILNFFLLMYESWDKSFKRYLGIYWYVTVMFSLSFFSSYMLFFEGCTVYWCANAFIAFVLSIIILDFDSFLIVFPVGIVLAYIVLKLNGRSVSMEIDESVFGHFYAMGYFGLIALMFSRDKEKIEQERLSALRALGGTLAHEMRTPLSTMSLMCKATDRRLRDDDFDKEKVLSGIKKMQTEVNEMMLAIDMILTRINAQQSADAIGKYSIKDCVNCTLERYPFVDNDRELVKFYCHNDFFFVGQDTAIVHILFNLIQNALYQIHSTNKGSIVISTIKKRKQNVLFFKDTASGISPEIYKRLFEPMVTGKAAGTGLGLHFCKTTMEAIDGDIVCRSEEGEYTEFILSFPPVETVSF